MTILDRLIGRARTEAEDELFREIGEQVDEQTKAKMLALLKVREGETKVGWLCWIKSEGIAPALTAVRGE